MVAYTVPTAEVLVRVVVKHAPREYAADVVGSVHCVKYLGMAQSMTQAVALIVKCFRGEHVSVALGDKIRAAFVGCNAIFGLKAGIIATV